VECKYIEKILFSITSRPVSIKLGTNHPWVKKNSELFKRRARFFSKGEIITEIQK
jgi:hypothetical protein